MRRKVSTSAAVLKWPTVTRTQSLRPSARVAALLGLLAACAQLTVDVEPPDVSVAGVGFGQPGLFEQELRLDLRLKNPNDFDIDVDSLRFNLDVDDLQFARGRTAEDFALPALGETVVPVTIAVPTNDLIDKVMELGTGEGPSYRLTGTAKLGGLLGVPIPFEREGRLELPRLPGLTPPSS